MAIAWKEEENEEDQEDEEKESDVDRWNEGGG